MDKLPNHRVLITLNGILFLTQAVKMHPTDEDIQSNVFYSLGNIAYHRMSGTPEDTAFILGKINETGITSFILQAIKKFTQNKELQREGYWLIKLLATDHQYSHTLQQLLQAKENKEIISKLLITIDSQYLADHPTAAKFTVSSEPQPKSSTKENSLRQT